MESLTVLGTSFKYLTLEELGEVLLSKEEILDIYKSDTSLSNFIILSTCNRIEVWMDGEQEKEVVQKLNFNPSYILKGKQAFKHMSEVGSGIDSQVIGETEILGQIRESIKLSKKYDRLGSLEGKVNKVIQVSKRVRTKTSIDKGVVTLGGIVSKYLEKNVEDISSKKVLIIGLGKIGRSVLSWITRKNKPYITVTVNRTPSPDQVHSLEDIKKWIHLYDITIVCTNASSPVLSSEAFSGLLLDLSVPYNVEGKAVRLEELNLIRDQNLENREIQARKGKIIIEEFLEELSSEKIHSCKPAPHKK